MYHNAITILISNNQRHSEKDNTSLPIIYRLPNTLKDVGQHFTRPINKIGYQYRYFQRRT